MSRDTVEQRLRSGGTAAELAQRAEELKATLATPSEREMAERELAEVERELVVKRRAEAKVQAEKRLKDVVQKAIPSLLVSFADDATRFTKAHNELSRAVETANDRYARITGLLLEVRALAAHFGIPTPELPHVLPPSRDQRFRVPPAELVDWSRVLPEVEKSADGLRTRRSFQEIADSPGYQIITASGLPPFPELNAAQRRLLKEQATDAREEQRQREALPNMAAVAHLPLGGTPL